MNFLELVQETMAILRIGQGDIGEEPATVLGQTGKLREVVRFVRRAWVDVQNDQTGWRFMRFPGQLTLAQGAFTALTSAIPDFDLLSVSDSDGRGRFITLFGDDNTSEQVVRYVPWQNWQQSYLQRGPRGEGAPANFTLTPSNNFEFDLIADRPYTISFWYKRTPQELLVDTDVPSMPARYHMAIVWWAIHRYYCTTRGDSQYLDAKAAQNLEREMRKLRHNMLDEYVCIEAGL